MFPTLRFNSYIRRELSGCWIWIGSKTGAGYGSFRLGRKQVSAHRLSYRIHKGEIPDGLVVCHHCDVPLCVNPDHLFVGTQKDNALDMVAKGRAKSSPNPIHARKGPSGEKSRTAKLTDAEVLKIRAETSPAKTIAEAYGVTPRTIAMIRSRETWRHI